MAEERDPSPPSLEPPSLFGRKKKKDKRSAAAAAPPEPASPSAPGAPTEPRAPVEPPPRVAQPVEAVRAEPAPDYPTPGEIAVPGQSTALVEPTEPAEPAELADAVGSAVAEPVAEPVGEPVAEPVPGPTPAPEPVPTADPVPVAQAALEPDDSPTTILDDAAPQPPVATEPAHAQGPAAPRIPWLRGRAAAVVTGVLVGALIVAATAGSLRLCTAVKGTSSCGGPGLFLLLAILIAAGLVGAALLRAAAVPQPGSTSFLAVGLVSVVTLLFLVDSIFEWWMIIAIPLVSVATFLLSHWVTTAYIEPENEASARQRDTELHDIR